MLDSTFPENTSGGLIGPVGFAISILIPVVVVGSYGFFILRRRSKIKSLIHRLGELSARHFLSQSCTKCNESAMLLLDVSPNSRSIHYGCEHCGKKSRAAAFSDEAQEAQPLFARFQKTGSTAQITFTTPDLPLPHEQTSREHIPAAVRHEVHRRDLGRCTQCGTNQGLQLDHIIPVSKGGNSTVANLQILCEPCNRGKAAKI